MDHTYMEIKSQFAALRKTFDYIAARQDEVLKFYKEKAPQSIVFTGCGSSYSLCQSAEFTSRIRLGKPAAAIPSGDLMLHAKNYLKMLEGALVIAPTRSGSTSEVIHAIHNVKFLQPSLPVIGITCVENSDLAKIADLTLEIPWAFDESVCQTRTVTNLYLVNLLVLAYLSGDQKLIKELDAAISAGDGFIAKYEGKLKIVAGNDWQDALILADGELQGLASEGALAFTEIARVPGRYHHLLDVRHGPMVLVNNRTLAVVSLDGEVTPYHLDLLRDLVQKGVMVITYSNSEIPPVPGVALQVSADLELDGAASGILFIYIAQALAYYKAIQKGVNPDQPEGLDPWIKL
ncbi:glucosamine--fructose-6-phosphate aminotransferase (isomerizing) [Hydrogenispora ethanolica]|jgi:fructoselysine-6-P-deglycase FrlB-like protein|uniref:Glucosamine--fructose-6-phosphate aminotransferase (Isomerizing) n=1 Tax=Hydrogenispora ethanolica TaxID=1082276 RepID=A0A4R1R0I7_HYDET|nr:SIS domain-containing protein [Hydrogenispora ethanolica]TCL58823.1 glucosamine--fructose-6-phosphate aminotransferase (isomerizing) [Hydrogenispora ethanolica]